MNRRVIAVALLALALGISGCAAEDASAPPSATPSAAPTPTPRPLTPFELAAERVTALTLREQAALTVMGAVDGVDPATVAGYVASGPRSLILMGGNIPAGPGELRALTDAVHATAPATLIATDQEGGGVARLHWDELPSARALKNEDPAQTRTAFAQRAQLLSDAGVDINFGVIADVPRTDSSFLFRRSFGTDPQTVADRVAAAVTGERGLVASTLKHFPGHGAAEGDSHRSIPTTDLALADWRATDAIPFQAGIDAGAELVMTGHLRLTAVSSEPASLSPQWYSILRDMGFEGVAVTDDLGMLTSSGEAAYTDPVVNAVNAIAAGADMVLMIAGSTPETATQIVDALVARAATDVVFADRLAEAATRVKLLADSVRD